MTENTVRISFCFKVLKKKYIFRPNTCHNASFVTLTKHICSIWTAVPSQTVHLFEVVLWSNPVLWLFSLWELLKTIQQICFRPNYIYKLQESHHSYPETEYNWRQNHENGSMLWHLCVVKADAMVLFLISPTDVPLMSSFPAPLRKEAEIHNPMFIL